LTAGQSPASHPAAEPELIDQIQHLFLIFQGVISNPAAEPELIDQIQHLFLIFQGVISNPAAEPLTGGHSSASWVCCWPALS
jgi:hypothetical protein